MTIAKRPHPSLCVRAAICLMFAALTGAGLQASAAVAATSDVPVLTEKTVATVELPLLAGWYEGHLVHYITTDMSDQAMAKNTGSNYVPRLSLALRPPVPGQPSALDRVYKFVNFAQGSVFPSAPQHVGYQNSSEAYTPLWLLYLVTWNEGRQPQILRSEEEVLDAVEKQWVTLTPTSVVVNCPVIYSLQDGLLPGARIHLR